MESAELYRDQTIILSKIAGAGGASGAELAAAIGRYKEVIVELKRAGVPIVVRLDDSGELRYQIGEAPAAPHEAEQFVIAQPAVTQSPDQADTLAAPPPSHSPADAPRLEEKPAEKPAPAGSPEQLVITRLYVKAFKIKAGGGRTLITAIPVDTGSAGAALELSGRGGDETVLVMDVWEKSVAERLGILPSEIAKESPLPKTKEKSMADIARELNEQEQEGNLPGNLASGMQQLLGGPGMGGGTI